MNELLKALKETGFPQEWKDGLFWTIGWELYYEPTTDELIAELGDRFICLRRSKNGWCAFGANCCAFGISPKEALMSLWISIHSN